MHKAAGDRERILRSLGPRSPSAASSLGSAEL
jgi:hypothetical protein